MKAILAEVFNFSPADIVANRKGELSAGQKDRIINKHYANSRIAWELFVIIFGLGLLGFSAEMIRIGNMNAKSLLTYFGLMFFLGLTLWSFILYYRHQMERTLQEGNVQPVKGKIQVITERREKVTNRYFCVGGYRFDIDRYEHFVLLQQSGVVGQEAIIYVSAPRQEILSVVLQA